MTSSRGSYRPLGQRDRVFHPPLLSQQFDVGSIEVWRVTDMIGLLVASLIPFAETFRSRFHFATA